MRPVPAEQVDEQLGAAEADDQRELHADVREEVDLQAELAEPRLHGLAALVRDGFEEVRKHVEDVLRDHLEEPREVRRVVAVDVDVEVDRLEHLHQHESLRHRHNQQQRSHRRDRRAHRSLRCLERRVQTRQQQVYRSQLQHLASHRHGRVGQFLQPVLLPEQHCESPGLHRLRQGELHPQSILLHHDRLDRVVFELLQQLFV